jgi:hypothetical protein
MKCIIQMETSEICDCLGLSTRDYAGLLEWYPLLPLDCQLFWHPVFKHLKAVLQPHIPGPHSSVLLPVNPVTWVVSLPAAATANSVQPSEVAATSIPKHLAIVPQDHLDTLPHARESTPSLPPLAMSPLSPLLMAFFVLPQPNPVSHLLPKPPKHNLPPNPP